MAGFRYPGPICQITDWFEDLDSGTLARTRSPLPATVGRSPARTTVLASSACAFLNPRSTGTVRAPGAAFDRLRNNSGTARIGSPQPKASQTWPDGSSSPAVEQTIQIGSQIIRVIRPTAADATGKNLPTTSQVAEALRAIPSGQRAHTSMIILSPRAHPSSTSTATTAGEAGSGEIRLFPMSGHQSQNDFDNRLTHESGHNYQGSLWKSAQAVSGWGTAATADNRLPSPYAGTNTGDDFCEFNILYNTAKGTACEATARQLYPNRWRKMVGY